MLCFNKGGFVYLPDFAAASSLTEPAVFFLHRQDRSC